MSNTPAKPSPTDTYSEYARQRYNLPDDWQWVSACWGGGPDAELPENICRLRGAVYAAKKTGKNKGKPNYSKPLTPVSTFFLMRDEFQAWKAKRKQEANA